MRTTGQQKDINMYMRATTINDSGWFKELVKEACKPSERYKNKLIISLSSEEALKRAEEVCERRNINFTTGMMDSCSNCLFVSMNWTTNEPRRKNSKSYVVLN